jgi:hypothetical protein
MYTKDGIGYQENDSSEEAAIFNTKGKVTLRQQVATLFDKHKSLTVEDVSRLMDRAEISVKPRVTELKKSGYIQDSGKRMLGKWGIKITVWEKV